MNQDVVSILDPRSSIHEQLVWQWIGRQPFVQCWQRQQELVEERQANTIPDQLLLVEHDHVVTLGRGGRVKHLRSVIDDAGQIIPVHRINRGGDVTYHGPGQLVGYPILDLRARGLGVHQYLHLLEDMLVSALTEDGVAASVREGHTGVWVEDRKIASLGIGVRNGVTLHGFALNVSIDLSCFDRVVPCGLEGVRMTSMAECGVDRSVEEMATHVARHFVAALEGLRNT